MFAVIALIALALAGTSLMLGIAPSQIRHIGIALAHGCWYCVRVALHSLGCAVIRWGWQWHPIDEPPTCEPFKGSHKA